MTTEQSPFKYDYAHNCKYTLIKDETESDEKYREEMLKVFNMETFEENIMVSRVEQLSRLLERDDKFNILCTKSANRYCLEELSMGLMLLFNCDSFHLIHQCLQDFNDSGEIENEHYNSVLKYLEN